MAEKDFPNNSSQKFLGLTKVVACQVFKDELEHLGINEEKCLFIDQELHRSPSELNKTLNETIRNIEGTYSPETIIVVYGYCGGALENISTVRANLILAKVTDCIPLLLGREPERIDPEGKGVYYVSRGWMSYAKYPYREYLELKEKYGHEDAYWSCKELLKSYKRVVSILNIPNDSLDWLKKAREFALFFSMEHGELRGDIQLLRSLLKGQPSGRVFRITPGRKVSKSDFE